MKTTKRILLIYYKLFKAGGIARVLTNLANELSEEGYRVEILVLTKPLPPFYELNPNINIHYIDSFAHWSWSICEWNMKLFSWVPKIRNLNAYIYHIGVFLILKKWINENQKNYDTVISSFYKLTSFLAINKKVNYKTIGWENVDYHIGGIFYKGILRKFYSKLKGIVCSNSPSVNYYEQFNRTHLISNIIGDPFESVSYDSIFEKENCITFVGRLDKEKNVIAILEILKSHPLPEPWRLRLVGDGPDRERLVQFVQENKMTSFVEFHGVKKADEVFELLQKSKIFVFTSLKEALPTVLLEAMFCGNALISYDCDYGPADIIRPENGFLIPVGEQDVFAEKLFELIHQPILLNRYMKSSLDTSASWNKEAIVEKWKPLL